MYQWIKDHVFKKEAPEEKCRGIVGIPAALDMWSDFPFWAGFWNSLGYRVMTSEWNEEDARQAAMTIPQRVHCHPCILAHGHLQNLIRQNENTEIRWAPLTKCFEKERLRNRSWSPRRGPSRTSATGSQWMGLKNGTKKDRNETSHFCLFYI